MVSQKSIHLTSAVSAGWTECVFGRNRTCCKTWDNPRRLYNLDRLRLPSINPSHSVLRPTATATTFSSCFLIVLSLCAFANKKRPWISWKDAKISLLWCCRSPLKRKKEQCSGIFWTDDRKPTNHLSSDWLWFWSEVNLNICTLDVGELKVVNSLVSRQWGAVPE